MMSENMLVPIVETVGSNQENTDTPKVVKMKGKVK
jgi:hypothetical protein